MRNGPLVVIIYTLFFNYTLLLLPVGAKFQQLIADPSVSSIPDRPSSGTPTAVPTTQPTQTSITQDIQSIQTRRINSILSSIPSPNSISSWWVSQEFNV